MSATCPLHHKNCISAYDPKLFEVFGAYCVECCKRVETELDGIPYYFYFSVVINPGTPMQQSFIVPRYVALDRSDIQNCDPAYNRLSNKPSIFARKSNLKVLELCEADSGLWLCFAAHLRRYPFRKCDSETARVIFSSFGSEGTSGRHSTLVQWALTTKLDPHVWFRLWMDHPLLRRHMAGFVGVTTIDFNVFTQRQLQTMCQSVCKYEHLARFVSRYIGDRRTEKLAA